MISPNSRSASATVPSVSFVISTTSGATSDPPRAENGRRTQGGHSASTSSPAPAGPAAGPAAVGLYSGAMPALAVNIDHVVTVRQARRAKQPDPVHAAVLAELGGASAIFVHLRADRRHVQDRDVEVLRQTVRTRLELAMAASQEMLRVALTVKPDQVTLVPERREELTTEGGLDVVLNSVQIRPMVKTLQDAGIEAALFVEPELEQIKEVHKLGARVVKVSTAAWGAAADARSRESALRKTVDAVRLARKLGFEVHAGHGLTLHQRQADRRAERDRPARDRPRDRGPRDARGHGAGRARDDRDPACGAGGPRLTPPGEPLMLSALR